MRVAGACIYADIHGILTSRLPVFDRMIYRAWIMLPTTYLPTMQAIAGHILNASFKWMIHGMKGAGSTELRQI